MATISKLTVGQVLYLPVRHDMGNTTRKTTSIYRCVVKEIDLDGGTVSISVNGNPPSWYKKKRLGRFRTEKPIIATNPMGVSRLATREEIKRLKAEEGK
jgi:hypothetical protein